MKGSMTRRDFMRILALGSGGALLVGCGQPAAPAQPTAAPKAAAPDAPTAAAAPAAPAAAAAAAPAGAVTAKFAAVQADDHSHTQGYKYFASKVKEYTNGKLIINVFPNSQLGNEREYIEQLRTGQIEFARVATAVLGPFVPQYQAFDLPYLFENEAQMLKSADGQLGMQLQKLLEDKLAIKGLGFWPDGSRSVYNRLRPIKTPADMKGMKIRLMENPLMLETFNALGAAATPMAYGEVYSALQQGVIDGAEGPINAYGTIKHWEVAKYFSYTEHFNTPVLPMVSKKWYDAQPKEFQDAIDKAAKDTMPWVRNLQAEQEKAAAADLTSKGVQINKVDDKAPFIKLAETVYPKYVDKIGKDYIDLARSGK